MAGLVPAIHALLAARKTWMPGIKPGMTNVRVGPLPESPVTARPIDSSTWRRRACRIACLIALGAMLAGCDRCGDWWSPMRGESQSCRDQAPKPQ